MNNITASEKKKLYDNNLNEIKKLNLELKIIRKSINKNLFFWLLIPLFGVFIYYMIRQKRTCDEQYLMKVTKCKVKISKLEIQNIKLLSEIEGE